MGVVVLRSSIVATDQKCGAAVWGKGSVLNRPLGHCSLPKGHEGKCMIQVETKKIGEVQFELDLDLTDPDPCDTWKPGRDIPGY